MSKKHYNIDTFLEETEQTKTDLIDPTVGSLYDFGKLVYGRYGTMSDSREPLVRKMLDAYDSETQMTIVLHDVLMDKTTLNKLLKQKGLM